MLRKFYIGCAVVCGAAGAVLIAMILVALWSSVLGMPRPEWFGVTMAASLSALLVFAGLACAVRFIEDLRRDQ